MFRMAFSTCCKNKYLLGTRTLQSKDWILYSYHVGNLKLVLGIADELQLQKAVFGFVSVELKIWECNDENL